MKKISLLLTLTVITAVAVQAQTPTIGLKGGLNLSSWTNNSNGAGYQNRLGFNAGLYAHIPAAVNLAIQPEVVYSSQGTKYTVSNVEHDLKLNYVNIPVMLQAMVGRGFYAEAGPQIGFLTGTADKVGDTETGYFATSDFKKTDVAVGFGLGYRGTSGFGIGARYNLGLTNINNFGTNKIKNNVLQIDLMMNLSGAMGRR
ncbi:MAG TPA: porin family protein [Flavisolibacter sp.]|nr:porin family protein [Flavisolibacter sp.]